MLTALLDQGWMEQTESEFAKDKPDAAQVSIASAEYSFYEGTVMRSTAELHKALGALQVADEELQHKLHAQFLNRWENIREGMRAFYGKGDDEDGDGLDAIEERLEAIRTSLGSAKVVSSEEEVLAEMHKLAAMENNLGKAGSVLRRSEAKGEEAERVGRDVDRYIFDWHWLDLINCVA